MHILAMDTSGPSLSVALAKDGRLVYECMQQNGLTHSDSLMPLVDAALRAGKLEPSEIDFFAVVVGPGSFTGVRIGVTTAKAMAHATGKHVLRINALEAIARGAGFWEGVICPMQDARAGQVYAAAYKSGHCVIPDMATKLDGFLAQLDTRGPCCFLGDGAAAHRDEIERAMGNRAVFPPASGMILRAANVAEIAAERLDQAVAWQEVMPYYLRAPQAERERLAREAANG